MSMVPFSLFRRMRLTFVFCLSLMTSTASYAATGYGSALLGGLVGFETGHWHVKGSWTSSSTVWASIDVAIITAGFFFVYRQPIFSRVPVTLFFIGERAIQTASAYQAYRKASDPSPAVSLFRYRAYGPESPVWSSMAIRVGPEVVVPIFAWPLP